MSRTVSPSTSRPYGLLRVARVWRVSRATLYRQRRHDALDPRRRPGPSGPLSDAALVDAIRSLLAASPSMARAIVSSGPGSASPASARPSAASCA
jgi:putative transposase